jgi:hypothetical protein
MKLASMFTTAGNYTVRPHPRGLLPGSGPSRATRQDVSLRYNQVSSVDAGLFRKWCAEELGETVFPLVGRPSPGQRDQQGRNQK